MSSAPEKEQDMPPQVADAWAQVYLDVNQRLTDKAEKQNKEGEKVEEPSK